LNGLGSLFGLLGGAVSKISKTDQSSILKVNFACQNRNISIRYDIKSIWKLFGKSKTTDSSAEIKT
jgi:hypothetical protein